jgi:CTP synthase
MKTETKYIFVVGGVMSGVGKGITTSSLALILKEYGYKVSAIKIDPYLNVDAGTMNPVEHGEVYVLSDGDECDQDMGNYERFLNTSLYRENYMTSGRIFDTVIKKERSLGYGGKSVQPIPHVTDEIISRIEKVGQKNEVVLIEIGGTVGEYENQLFLEAARIMKNKYRESVAVTLVSYAPIPGTIGEMKTKPTQHASRLLNEHGLQADILIIRSTEKIDDIRKEKISMFCNIDKENIISAPDIKSVYDVPINFEADKLGAKVISILKLKKKIVKKEILSDWKKFFSYKNSKKVVRVAVVCKYIDSGDFVLNDAYISVIESIKYASYASGVGVKIEMLSSESFEKNTKNLKKLSNYNAIVVPGGFGSRGTEGKILAIKYARENNIPILGICYGMQLMVIEYMRNVLKVRDANSTEIDKKTKNPVIDIINSQKEKLENSDMGNSMRLGDCVSLINKKSLAYSIYKKDTITERHRHRYEVNPEYYDQINSKDLKISAYSEKEGLAEIVELSGEVHKYFVGCQFHPEFLSRPMHPHPLFLKLIKKAISKK